MAKATTTEQEPKEKANFNLRISLIRKLKIISATDNTFQGDIVDELLTDYINKWEKKHGEIKLK